MTSIPTDPPGVTPAALPERDLELLRSAKQLEGVFVEHLFRAMRDTVPEGGLVDGGSGEEIFTSLIDRQLADQLAAGWDDSLGSAIYRQLRSMLTESEPSADTLP